MTRLTLAALLALGLHAAALWMEVPWTGPTLMVPQSRQVSIDLVAYQPPMETPPPPEPKQKKPPQPRSVPEPAPEPAVRPIQPESTDHPPQTPETPSSDTSASEPDPILDPQPAEEIMPAEAQADSERADDQASVKASVPRYDLNPPPHYPRTARRRNYQGTVLLDVLVTTQGRVSQVRIAQSSGYGILDRSAVESVKGWRFTPAKRGIRPIETWVQVPIRYELHDQ